MVSEILISVIIPTYNRNESLQETLASLAQQTYPSEHFEVVVVDDGSTDGTGKIAQKHFPFHLQYIKQENRGSASARNAGADNARGSLLIFIDDDILVEPDYLGELYEKHHKLDRIIGMGRLLPDLPEHATIFGSLYSEQNNSDINESFVDFTACGTANLSIRKRDFLEIGGMQDVAGDGQALWGDVAFGFRAYKLGYRFIQSGKATCIHCDYSLRDLASACKRNEKAAFMAHALFQKHPDIQQYLPMFHDKTSIAWDKNPPSLIARKLARKILSAHPAIWVMKQIVKLLETCYQNPAVLRSLYRWVISGHIYRGYRHGLKEYRAPAFTNQGSYLNHSKNQL
jgi:glycosyltransferase involved in cell wall biosynthesis